MLLGDDLDVHIERIYRVSTCEEEVRDVVRKHALNGRNTRATGTFTPLVFFTTNRCTRHCEACQGRPALLV
jgi:hypothetical protein